MRDTLRRTLALGVGVVAVLAAFAGQAIAAPPPPDGGTPTPMVVGGTQATKHFNMGDMYSRPGYMLELARQVKQVTTRPVMARPWRTAFWWT